MLKCNLNLSKCLLQFVRPIRSSHIRIHRSDGTVVFSVDVAITAGVLYPVGSLGRTIQFTTSQTFTEKESYYLTMDHGKDTGFISWSFSLCNRCWTYHPMKSPPYNFLQTTFSKPFLNYQFDNCTWEESCCLQIVPWSKNFVLRTFFAEKAV